MSKDLERSIKDRVKEIAKAENRTFNVVWKTLVLERFLARLSRSTQINNLIFKGGMLLSKVPESFFEIVWEIDRWIASKDLIKQNEAL